MTRIQTGTDTRCEILQQPDTWLDTIKRCGQTRFAARGPLVVAGAGSSYYAARAVETAWPGARAIPSTDLLLDCARLLGDARSLMSLARSGDSPESEALVRSVQRERPDIQHFAIICNPDGALAHLPRVEALLLDPRTNDRSLVMTSSFSNLALAGSLLGPSKIEDAKLTDACLTAAAAMPELDAVALRLARRRPARVVFLASPVLSGAALEAGLKILEMTAGRVCTLAESFLGLRHGPMSFLEPDTLVVCFISSNSDLRRYELDLIAELRTKGLGYLVGIVPDGASPDAFDTAVSSPGARLPDWLRTPFDIILGQFLALHLSQELGFHPDNPSPESVITRVVRGVTIYDA